MYKLFIDKIEHYKDGSMYINSSIVIAIRKCILELTKFSEKNNLNVVETAVSFLDYTFSNNNVRVSVLNSYLNGFYDNYSMNTALFKLVEFNEEQTANFFKFCGAYQQQLINFYQHHVELERIEILKQAFVRIQNEISINEYEDFITAQFVKLEWTEQAVTVFHLNSDKALLRYLEWKKKNRAFKREDSWYEKMIEENK